MLIAIFVLLVFVFLALCCVLGNLITIIELLSDESKQSVGFKILQELRILNSQNSKPIEIKADWTD